MQMMHLLTLQWRKNNMAITWSWAFGAETTTQLEEMGWDWQNTGAGNPVTTTQYTYIGSPTRYSMSQNDQIFADLFRLPTQTFQPQGWVSFAFYYNSTTATLNGRNLVSVTDGGSGNGVYIRLTNSATNTYGLYVDNVFKEAFTMLPDRWNYVGLQYDMSTSTWSGRVFLDGVAVTATHTDSRAIVSTGGVFFSGLTNGYDTFFAQVVLYDSPADAGETPYFVTRVDPMADVSVTGLNWTINGGAPDNHSALESPFNTATNVNDDPTTSGNDVIVSTTNLATQLGTAPTTFGAVTIHTWATGSGVTGRTELSDDNTAYVAGNTITPSVNATYSYATSETQPSSGTPWTSGDNIFYKYEVI